MSPFYDISLIDLLEEVQKAWAEGSQRFEGLKGKKGKTHLLCSPRTPRTRASSEFLQLCKNAIL